MKIKPTDWVLFTIKTKSEGADTQFCQANFIPKNWLNHFEKVFYYHYDYLDDLVNSGKYAPKLHLVVPRWGGNYAYDLKTLFKALNSPKIGLLDLDGLIPLPDGKKLNFGPKEALKSRLGFEAKKILGADYLKTLYQNVINCNKKELLNTILMLEERPKKAKQFLIELRGYNREKRTITDKRTGIVFNFDEPFPVDSNNVIQLLFSLYVNQDDDWDMTHSILSIGDGCYQLGSGNTECTAERIRLICGSDPLLTIDMTSPNLIKLFYSEEINGKTRTGEEIFHAPAGTDPDKILKYYRKKFPKKNYKFNKEIVQKALSERSKYLASLPKKGETPAKNLRKICYKPKGGDRIFRDRLDKVQPLLDSGNYEPASKLAWKRQKVIDGKLLKKGEAYKSNITLPVTGNIEDLGKRKVKREKRDEERRARSSVRGFRLPVEHQLVKKDGKVVRYIKHRVHTEKKNPGDVQRTLQSEKDKKKYVKKRKEEGKPYISQRTHRAFEAVILGEKNSVLATVQIKAKSDKHANDVLSMIVNNKKGKGAVSGKLTGNVREWIKPTGKQRPKKTNRSKGR